MSALRSPIDGLSRAVKMMERIVCMLAAPRIRRQSLMILLRTA